MKKELLAALVIAALAGHAPAIAKETITVNAGLGVGYSDNLLQYSDQQLGVFDSGTNPAQFSIRTSDDMFTTPSFGLEYLNARPGGRSTELALRGNAEWHDKNPTADGGGYGATWRESFAKGRRLSVSAYRMPHYYLRQLWDDDFVRSFPGQPKYRRAEFSLTKVGTRWRQRVAEGAWADIGWLMEVRDYGEHFNERDSKLHQFGGGFDWTRPKRASFGVDAAYEKSVAEATDGDDAGLAVPDDPDVSFHALVFGAHVRARMAQSKRTRLDADLGLELEKRTYDSDRVADRYHLGRKDTKTAFEAGLRLGFLRNWTARATFRHEANDAKLGTAAPASADAGSYAENRGTLSLDWSGEVWHRFRKRSSGAATTQP